MRPFRANARAVILTSLALVAGVGFAGPGATAAQAAPSPPQGGQVLVVYSDERLLPANVLLDEAIRNTFATNPANPTEFYSEFLDVSRFTASGEEERQYQFIRAKYA